MTMEEQIVHYFSRETKGSMLLIALGVIGLLIAIVLLTFSKKKWLIGFSYPTSLVAVIQLAMGGFIYWRTPNQLGKLQALFLSTPQSFLSTEQERMEKVLSSFILYSYIEMGLIVLGIILFFVAYKTRGFIFGAGLSLLLYGIILFGFDQFANQRAELYYDSLIKTVTLEK